ncbi:MAG TPA: GtrA family protein [Chthoniobacterales bacterium]|nr:GtrA family protein [Chthoniobacterales bacterium]
MRFATVGASVAMIDFGSVAVLSRLSAPLVAVSIAYFIGVTCHFLLNKFWVFRCRRKDYSKQLLQYGAVTLNSWIITVVAVQVCLSSFTSNVLIAKLCAIPCATICNFLLMQLVVFRANRPTPDIDEIRYSSPVGESD